MPNTGFSTDFIVRIYRYNRKKPRPFLGIVEKVGQKEKLAFTTRDELWEILSSSSHYPDDMERQG